MSGRHAHTAGSIQRPQTLSGTITAVFSDGMYIPVPTDRGFVAVET